ncbi:MAG: hypothetical protein FWD40_01985 [Treponema sp.]|nr:hypothetical protein [Treponema sp.]
MNRRRAYENIFSAKSLFIAGLLIMPALLFNPGTEYRLVQFLFFWFLAWLCGKKTNPVITVLIIAFIVIFNLLIPYGRVLFSVGAFKITSGALTAGIHRAITLAALVMLSKVFVRQDLKLPGAFGELLGESLRMFSVIINKKYKISGKNLVAEIDSLLLELSGEEYLQEAVKEQKTKPAGYAILLAALILSWLPFFLAVSF